MSSSSEAQMKKEIARLTATINMHKSASTSAPQAQRPNTYVNPNYKPRNTYVRPQMSAPPAAARPPPSSSQVKEVVLNGVAFQSSSRSLVRKDLPKPPSTGNTPAPQFARKSGHLVQSHRVYKPISSRGKPRVNRNMTLTNNRRPYQARKLAKRMKYSDKPCPRFSTTGAPFSAVTNSMLEARRPLVHVYTRLIGSCSRGLTCMYAHDPDKIAVCWNFLQGNCPKTAETCDLSHDPTPERTPLCLHFLNKGRCTRLQCPFPHVNVGARNGVCRDFAVLGYCAKGLDCDKQHVRECPDFAEKGACTTKGCKLPHVIRANRNRKPAPAPAQPVIFSDTTPAPAPSSEATPAAGQLGDEYISLTFNESESEESDEEEDEEQDEDENSEDEAVSESDITPE